MDSNQVKPIRIDRGALTGCDSFSLQFKKIFFTSPSDLSNSLKLATESTFIGLEKRF
jgi:hypothetical protein